MLGDSGVWTYTAYALVGALLLAIVVVFLRLVVMLSLLWLMPLAAVLRRVPGLRRIIPVEHDGDVAEEGRRTR